MATYYRKAAELIIGFEGFRSAPYGDVNNYRIGFGSSTYMLSLNSTPQVLPRYNPSKDKKTLPEPKINIQQAAYDLRRRLVEFEREVRVLLNKQRAGLYEKLSDEAKAACISITYNGGGGFFRRPYGITFPELIAQADGSSQGVSNAIQRIRDLTPAKDIVNKIRRDQEAKYVVGTFTPRLVPGVDYSIFDNMTSQTDTPRAESTAGRSSSTTSTPYIASFKSFHPRVQYELTRRKFSTETVNAYMPFVNLTSLLYVNRGDSVETRLNQNIPDSQWGWCPSLGVHAVPDVKNIRFEQLYNPTVNVDQLQNRSVVGVATTGGTTLVRSPQLLAASTDIEPLNIPSPGISNVTVERTLAGPMGVRGGLIRANMKIVAYSKGQVDTLLKYFLRPGTNLVLELGRMATKAEELNTFNWKRNLTDIKEELEGIVQLQNNELQNEFIKKYVYGNNGNYEIFIGYATKFNIKYTKENLYDIELSMNSIQQFEIPTTHTGVKSICASPTSKCAAMDAREYFSPLYAWKEKTFSRLLKSAITTGGNLYTDWNRHVVPVKDSDSTAGTSAGTDTAYFITWKFFIDKVLNDENLGLLSIFPQASRNTVRSGLLSPSTTEGEIIKNNEALVINEVNYHPDLRSVDPNVMIIINKQAQAKEDVQEQFRFAEAQFRGRTQNYESTISSPLEKRLSEELDMDDFAPAEQSLRNVSGVSSLLRGVWLNTNAIIAAFDRTDTISSALDALLVEMNRATEGYWNLQLLSNDSPILVGTDEWKETAQDKKKPIFAPPGVHVIDMGLSKTITITKPDTILRDALLTNVTALQNNKEAILQTLFGKDDTPSYIYVFNERNRVVSNTDSIGSELIDVNINFDLPLAIATQVIAGVGGPAQKGTLQVINVEELEGLKIFPSLSNICAESEPDNARCAYDPLVDYNIRLNAIENNYKLQKQAIENNELLSDSGKRNRLKDLEDNTIVAKNNLYNELGRYASVQNQFAELGDFGSSIRYIEINPSSMVKKLNSDSRIGEDEPETANKKRPISHAWNSSNLTKVLVDLTLPGIGGIQLFQTFLVERIPSVIQQGYYVVVKIVHEFTTQNGWITKIQGRFRYLPPEE